MSNQARPPALLLTNCHSMVLYFTKSAVDFHSFVDDIKTFGLLQKLCMPACCANFWAQFTYTAKSVWFSWPRAGRCGYWLGVLHSCIHDLWQWKLWRHWKINIIIARKQQAKQLWSSMFHLQTRWLEVAGVERSRNFRWEPRPWQLKLFEANFPWYRWWLCMEELVHAINLREAPCKDFRCSTGISP